MKFPFSLLVKIREKKNDRAKLRIVTAEKTILLSSDIDPKNKIWVAKYALLT